VNHLSESMSREFDQCIKCGLCHATCPVCKELLLEKYSPRGKIQLARYYTQGDLELSDHYREIFGRCLLCGACVATCPSGVDLNKVFLDMRREIADSRGLHPNMEAMVRSLMENRNISDDDNEDRGEWRDAVKDIPEHLYEKKKADVAYFVGCVSSFFPMVQNIPVHVAGIMESAGVDFGILAGEEWCCGFPLIAAGAPEKAQELMDHNLEKVKAMGAKQVVFSCPTCQRTWKEYYGTDLELRHVTQMVERLVKEGALRFKPMDLTVTYHDPCDLGRNQGIFDSPREILKAIPGVTLVEMENNRAGSVCCGGGGNLEAADAALSGTMARKKIEEIQRTGADIVVTSCQQCVRTIKAQVRRDRVRLEVKDLTEFVAEALEKP
jgi:heterodisulfide reductase subunit D